MTASRICCWDFPTLRLDDLDGVMFKPDFLSKLCSPSSSRKKASRTFYYVMFEFVASSDLVPLTSEIL